MSLAKDVLRKARKDSLRELKRGRRNKGKNRRYFVAFFNRPIHGWSQWLKKE